MAERRCIFCRGKANSREDAWPVWLLKLFSLEGTHTFTAEFTRRGLAARPAQTWETGARAIRVRCVCVSCNTGWMSDLEGDIAPVLMPLIDGDEVALRHDQQLLLGWWAAKTAMVFEATHYETVVSFDEERDMVRTQKRAPATMQIRLATYAGTKYSLAHLRYVVLGNPDSEETPDLSYTTNLLIGKLVIQVFRPSSLMNRRSFQHVGIPGDHFVPVLPMSVSGIKWPPTKALDDEGFEQFAQGTFPADTPRLPDNPQ